MQRIPEKIDSKFRFVLLASNRAEQIMRGAQPKMDLPGAKLTRVAMEEILEDRISWDYGPEESPEDGGAFDDIESIAGGIPLVDSPDTLGS